MLMLFVHESGHIWAMKECGMKTKGIYFIPFLGGAAVADDEFPDRWSEVYVAIMGPVWGMILSAFTAGVYAITEIPLFAAAAAWMAMMNLFNLLPINPLDGGRIFKSIAFSVHSTLGMFFLGVGCILSGYIAIKIGFGLFFVLLVAGMVELLYEWRIVRKRRRELEQRRREEHVEQIQAGTPISPALVKDHDLNGLELFYSVCMFLAVATGLWFLLISMEHVPGAEIAKNFLS